MRETLQPLESEVSGTPLPQVGGGADKKGCRAASDDLPSLLKRFLHVLASQEGSSETPDAFRDFREEAFCEDAPEAPEETNRWLRKRLDALEEEQRFLLRKLLIPLTVTMAAMTGGEVPGRECLPDPKGEDPDASEISPRELARATARVLQKVERRLEDRARRGDQSALADFETETETLRRHAAALRETMGILKNEQLAHLADLFRTQRFQSQALRMVKEDLHAMAAQMRQDINRLRDHFANMEQDAQRDHRTLQELLLHKETLVGEGSFRAETSREIQRLGGEAKALSEGADALRKSVQEHTEAFDAGVRQRDAAMRELRQDVVQVEEALVSRLEGWGKTLRDELQEQEERLVTFAAAVESRFQEMLAAAERPGAPEPVPWGWLFKKE